ncbi:hypothetical protein AB0K52_21025 [Glycomyces sp. NPDC049804]|uniref:hypothetical protein n=1 Tax=Glycomyces sp. NPDC049804 TaxID=3154363 RepID=UPI0034316241
MVGTEPFDEPWAAGQYAAVRRRTRALVEEFARQPGSSGRRVDRATWARVIEAMNDANRHLARCDGVWLEMRALYLEVMAGNAVRFRVRREGWAASILTACRYLGPDHEITERMKRARDSADWYGRQPASGTLRQGLKVAADVDRHLGELAVGKLRRAALKFEHLSLVIATVAVKRYEAAEGDAAVAIAGLGAELCHDLGEVEIARALFKPFYEEVSAVTPEGVDDLLLLAEARTRMGTMELLNGDAAAAEPLVRTVERDLQPSPRFAGVRRAQHRRWMRALDDANALLADCLFVGGKRNEAGRHYREAYEGYLTAGGEGPGYTERLSAAFNAAVFTAGAWWKV